MFSPIARWSALSALLFLGATVLPPSLQGQQSAAADRSTTAAQALTVAANPLLINTGAKAGSAERSIMVRRAGPAPVVTQYLAFSDPLLAHYGITIPVPATPLALNIVPKQDDGFGVGSNLALVGVGTAAFLVGMALDNDAGTVIAVGGGVAALIGLYRWLK